MDFVPIPDCDGYFINKNGEILSKKRKKHKILKQRKTEYGYMRIHLTINDKGKHLRVHRLLALTFIDNPNNHKMVDHINRIRDDNRLENLRWVNRCQNAQNSKKPSTNKSGHKNIHLKTQRVNGKEYSSWGVEITHNHEWACTTKRFKTLEEAIVHRDKILNELNREII